MEPHFSLSFEILEDGSEEYLQISTKLNVEGGNDFKICKVSLNFLSSHTDASSIVNTSLGFLDAHQNGLKSMKYDFEKHKEELQKFLTRLQRNNIKVSSP